MIHTNTLMVPLAGNDHDHEVSSCFFCTILYNSSIIVQFISIFLIIQGRCRKCFGVSYEVAPLQKRPPRRKMGRMQSQRLLLACRPWMPRFNANSLAASSTIVSEPCKGVWNFVQYNSKWGMPGCMQFRMVLHVSCHNLEKHWYEWRRSVIGCI